jgi:hypothetical protein
MKAKKLSYILPVKKKQQHVIQYHPYIIRLDAVFFKKFCFISENKTESIIYRCVTHVYPGVNGRSRTVAHRPKLLLDITYFNI